MRTGTKPRRRKLQYLEKWNRDSRQDNGIDLVHLWKRLKEPRNKDFLFLYKSCCSLDKTSAVRSAVVLIPAQCGGGMCRVEPLPGQSLSTVVFFQWPIAHQLLNKMLCDLFIFFFAFFLSRSTDINTTEFLQPYAGITQKIKSRIVKKWFEHIFSWQSNSFGWQEQQTFPELL